MESRRPWGWHTRHRGRKDKKFEPKILESTIKAAVKKRLKELEAYQFWPVQQGLGAATLDCIGCYLGTFFAIETKRPGGKLTARQKLTIEQMRLAGAAVWVIDSIEQAQQWPELSGHGYEPDRQ